MPPTSSTRKPVVLVTSIAGRFGRLLARALHGSHEVLGLDLRGDHHMPKDVRVFPLDLRRKKAEDVFRRERIDAVVHLPAEGMPGESMQEHRSRTVLGTRKVLSYCHEYDIPKLVIVSTAALYGANPDNPQFLSEEAPLLAGRDSPLLRDLVEADMTTNSFFWQHPEVDTVLLRPVHMVGRLSNPASRYLRLSAVPTVMGFDPMVQVVSPEDVSRATLLALKPGIRGVFNIAGPSPAPLSRIIERCGRRALPLPEVALRAMLGLALGIGRKGIGAAELTYLKYVCMVDDSRARDVLGYRPLRTLDQTLIQLRA